MDIFRVVLFTINFKRQKETSDLHNSVRFFFTKNQLPSCLYPYRIEEEFRNGVPYAKLKSSYHGHIENVNGKNSERYLSASVLNNHECQKHLFIE